MTTLSAKQADSGRVWSWSRQGEGMDGTSWEALLPRMFADAGIDATAGFSVEPLTGGVSSDIVRIRLKDGRDFAAKRALPQLKVATEWKAPLERNHYEVAWLRRANSVVPGAAPQVLAEDREYGVALLEYLPAEDFVLWKSELLAGRADPNVAVAVADALGRIHAATLNDPSAAAEFPTDDLIDALRLDPYLRFTASRHPDLSPQILSVLNTTWTTKLALVHGDVSPKNILISKRDGHPVLLDAECAWFGDPAFDAAFCLNHLLLKSVHLLSIKDELLREAKTFTATWLSHFPASLRASLDSRVAALLPCLMLARVDGKSPVEYLSETGRQRVRELAIPLIKRPRISINAVVDGVSS
jgi:aminoglycoside phosphotransferase (APT) family kinase protein